MLSIEIVFPAESCESTVDVEEGFPKSLSEPVHGEHMYASMPSPPSNLFPLQ